MGRFGVAAVRVELGNWRVGLLSGGWGIELWSWSSRGWFWQFLDVGVFLVNRFWVFRFASTRSRGVVLLSCLLHRFH